MDHQIVSTAYVPLQPPYQVIKYDSDVAMQIGTLVVTVQKKGAKDYQIETHSHPVVAYEDKGSKALADEQLTSHQFLEGAVWNKVEVRDVTTVCLAGATLSWEQFLAVLDHETLIYMHRKMPDIDIYWRLIKLGVKILPPEVRACTIHLQLMPHPEELGLSLQSAPSSPLFLNVSVAEDEVDAEHVFYSQEKKTWYSDDWKDGQEVRFQLEGQLLKYNFVLRDLLYGEEDNRFTVKYETNAEQYQKIVEQLNKADRFTNLSYI